MAPPPDSRALGPIWPGRLAKLLACSLQVAFDQGVGDVRGGPASPSALVGTAIHRCIELLIGDRNLTVEQAWTNACDEMCSSGPDPREAPPARRAVLRLQKRFPDLKALVDGHESTSDPLLEEELQSSDGLFQGQPDIVLIGRRTTIIDYKTGTATADGTVNPDYVNQLLLYAWLVADVLSTDQVDACLFSLRDGLIHVDVSPERRQEWASTAKESIRQFEGAVPGPQPGNPSDTACEWCNHVLDCDDVWAAFEEGGVRDLGRGHAVEGVVTGAPTHARNGRSALSLEVERGTLTGHIMVCDLPTTTVLDYVDGLRIRATRLGQRSDEPVALAWKDHRSRIAKVR